MEIRNATIEDAEELLKIYSYYVEKTAISFEYDVPTLEEFRERVKNISAKYPYLVAVDEGKIVGYCYAGTFKARAAYDHCVETTVYVDNGLHRKGVGKFLYAHLEEELKNRGIRNAYACIAVCDVEDEYLTNNSWHFHEHLGYELVGRFHKCGYKFDNWYDMIWMEKMLY
ncbi:MAG: N-acetyltransferase family protein [Lachnospiraceae bacterium]|nr:N-acetyltransferase family protein [Lachnospiraceae bacterium]